MATATKSLAISLQEAQARIFTLEQRKGLLKSTHPNELTDGKIYAFVESVQTWYPVYTCYGGEVRKTLQHKIQSFIDKKEDELDTTLGKAEAAKDMKKFRKFLEKDIIREIEDLASGILNNQQFIDRRVAK
ncbi:MAG: hypothetical protein K940chlam4_00376 [Candidatus Anoxychlamydiales bacterium]|nr:hypothetical protein [Candidatus Anoxychlamydiales bacterium]